MLDFANMARYHPPQYVVGSFACIGGGLFGLDISSMSGVLNVRFVLLSSTLLWLTKIQNEAYLKQFHFVGVHFHSIILLENTYSR